MVRVLGESYIGKFAVSVFDSDDVLLGISSVDDLNCLDGSLGEAALYLAIAVDDGLDFFLLLGINPNALLS